MGMKGFKGFEKDFPAKGNSTRKTRHMRSTVWDTAIKALCISVRTRGRF